MRSWTGRTLSKGCVPIFFAVTPFDVVSTPLPWLDQAIGYIPIRGCDRGLILEMSGSKKRVNPRVIRITCTVVDAMTMETLETAMLQANQGRILQKALYMSAG